MLVVVLAPIAATYSKFGSIEKVVEPNDELKIRCLIQLHHFMQRYISHCEGKILKHGITWIIYNSLIAEDLISCQVFQKIGNDEKGRLYAYQRHHPVFGYADHLPV